MKSKSTSISCVLAVQRYHGWSKQHGEGCSLEETAVGWAQLTALSRGMKERLRTSGVKVTGWGFHACLHEVIVQACAMLLGACVEDIDPSHVPLGQDPDSSMARVTQRFCPETFSID